MGKNFNVVKNKFYNLGAFQIGAGWWGHQPGLAAVVSVHTDHLEAF